MHGACGLDHFVHRFTHRVVRGLLIAVGRPDGRLCCLSKSEAAVLLSAKQVMIIVIVVLFLLRMTVVMFNGVTVISILLF